MNLSQIEEEIRDCIHEEDEGIELEDSLTQLVNEALEEISESSDVATLRRMNVVQTDTTAPYLVMPSDFSGRLLYAGDSDGKLSILKGGLQEMLELYPTLAEAGNIEYLAVENKLLYYQPIPSSITSITVLYYASPTKLVAAHDVPEWLPEYLHRGLIVNKAVEMRFRKIEEGIEGEMINTAKYKGYFEESKTMLEMWLSRRRSSVGTSVWTD